MSDFPDWGVIRTLNTTLTTLIAAINALVAGWGTKALATASLSLNVPATGNLIGAQGIGVNVVLVDVVVTWRAGNAATNRTLRGGVYFQIANQGTAAIAVEGTLSPEEPSRHFQFAPGSKPVGPNALVQAASSSDGCASTDLVVFDVTYYLG